MLHGDPIPSQRDRKLKEVASTQGTTFPCRPASGTGMPMGALLPSGDGAIGTIRFSQKLSDF
jgi:hypothetical protein